MDPTTDLRTRRRAGARLVTAALILVCLAAIVAAVLIARTATAPQPNADTPVPPRESVPAGDPGWDLATESELAARPMLSLPIHAAQPHELTTQSAGPDISLPAPTSTAGRWIPEGYPATPEGALAQLAAIDETGAGGGDPATYVQAYQQFALPGAPSADLTALTTVLTHFRASAGIPPGQPKPGLEVSFQVTHGLIKGTTDAGRYAVVCVLGQLGFRYQGSGTSFGIGDCQAMRQTAAGWRISPGVRAAYAPSAWPGTLDAVKAGYRALTGGAR